MQEQRNRGHSLAHKTMFSPLVRFFNNLRSKLHHPPLPERTISSDEYFALVAAGHSPLIAPNLNSEADEAKMPDSIRRLLAIPGVHDVRLALCEDSVLPDEVSIDQLLVAARADSEELVWNWSQSEGACSFMALSGSSAALAGFTETVESVMLIMWD